MWSVRKLTVLLVLAVALCGSGTAIASEEKAGVAELRNIYERYKMEFNVALNSPRFMIGQRISEINNLYGELFKLKVGSECEKHKKWVAASLENGMKALQEALNDEPVSLMLVQMTIKKWDEEGWPNCE